jgi:molybdate transport system substrate-binding protein
LNSEIQNYPKHFVPAPVCFYTRSIQTICITLVLVLLLALPLKVQSNPVPLIAAASDLQFALTDIAALFHSQTGQTVRLSFGSSGNFARQIRQGAPFDIYFSADEDYIRDLFEDGFTRDEGVIYGVGRVVIIAPHESKLSVDDRLDGLRSLLTTGRLKRFAIANPDHAPYGKRARELLAYYGLWDDITPHLIIGENISQAAQFATSSSAQGGIIAYSLALSASVAELGNYALIPEESHSKLRQRMVLLKNAGDIAEQFFDFAQQQEARIIFRQYGFKLAGEGN